jgi:HSP20 family protein
MDIFDDRKKRRNGPFDEEFEHLFRQLRKMWENTLRDFSVDKIEPGKPYVYGFNLHIGPDGIPKINEFRNQPKQTDRNTLVIPDEIEPPTDIIEGDKDVSITVDIPGVEKEDIDLKISENTLEISVNNPKRKYHKLINLPCDVNPKKSKVTYKNGVLDVLIKRKKNKKNRDGYHINIE